MTDSEKIKKIELHSEDVKDILGNPPSFLVRWSITIIFFVIITLLIASCFIKYPDVVNTSCKIEHIITPNNDTVFIAKVKIPSSSIGKIKINQWVNIKLNQYSYMEFGQLRCEISQITYKPISGNKGVYYVAEAFIGKKIITSNNREVKYIEGLYGTSEVILAEKALIFRLIQPLKNL